LPFSVDPKEIADGKAAIAKHCQALGRDPKSIDITLFAPDGFFRQPQELAEVAAAGANGVVLWLQGQSEAAIVAELQELAGRIF